MKSRKAKKGILIDVALLLLCLMCITACISSGILAKFASESGGNASARIAKFDVSASLSGNGEPVVISGNEPPDYTVTVSNNSESVVSYSIILKFSGDVSDFIQGARVNDTFYQFDKTGNMIVMNDLGYIRGGEASYCDFSLIMNSVVGGAEISFETMVRFTQVD